MRLVLCLVLFACTAALGFLAAERLVLRCKAIETMQSILDALCMRLKHYKEPLRQAVRNTARHIGGEGEAWLLELACQLESQGEAQRALAQTLAKNKPPNPLNEYLGAEEKTALGDLFERIGSHSEDQEAAFLLCKERLKTLLCQAREQAQRRGKLYRMVGALLGAIWVILFI